MKKFICFTLLLSALCTLLFTGCNKQKEEPLLKYVSELRQDVFYGETDELKLKANYGYKEFPSALDGKPAEHKKYSLTFILAEKPQNAEYVISYSYGNDLYKKAFKFSPVTERLTAEFDIENFAEKEFSVTVSYAGKNAEITLKSLLPENTVGYADILTALREKQGSLIESLYENGNMTAEIILRVLVKNEHPYYYVGICKGNYLKAFLMDGINKEILAIREVA